MKEVRILIEQRHFEEGSVVRHFKYYQLSTSSQNIHCKEYTILAHAIDTETGANMVVYKELAPTRRVFVRDAESFYSEVDRNKYPHSAQRYRFELLDPQLDSTVS